MNFDLAEENKILLLVPGRLEMGRCCATTKWKHFAVVAFVLDKSWFLIYFLKVITAKSSKEKVLIRI